MSISFYNVITHDCMKCEHYPVCRYADEFIAFKSEHEVCAAGHFKLVYRCDFFDADKISDR